MGGTIIEIESEKWIRSGMNQGRAQMIIELGQKDGLDDVTILKRMQEKVGLSLEEAVIYLKNMAGSLCKFVK